MRGILVMLVVASTSMVADEARAQFLIDGPGGSLGIQSPSRSYTFVYPGRLHPLANIAQPGTHQMTPWGNMWLGYDSRIHGNLINPMTGNLHLKSLRSTSYARPSRHATSRRRR